VSSLITLWPGGRGSLERNLKIKAVVAELYRISVPITQILEMRSWTWIRVCILLGFSVAHGGLTNTCKWPVS
jgi:hypothetical protein